MTRRRAADQAQAAFARISIPAPPPSDGQTPSRRDAAASRPRDVTPPRSHEPTPAQARDATTPRGSDLASPRVRDVTPPRRRRGPVVADAVAFTVRFDPDEAVAVDELTLALRRAAGGRVDKSELVRALLQLARDDSYLRKHLADVLRDDTP